VFKQLILYSSRSTICFPREITDTLHSIYSGVPLISYIFTRLPSNIVHYLMHSSGLHLQPVHVHNHHRQLFTFSMCTFGCCTFLLFISFHFNMSALFLTLSSDGWPTVSHWMNLFSCSWRSWPTSPMKPTSQLSWGSFRFVFLNHEVTLEPWSSASCVTLTRCSLPRAARLIFSLQTYVKSQDKAFAAATIQAIGRCATDISEVTDTCLSGLVLLLSNRDGKKTTSRRMPECLPSTVYYRDRVEWGTFIKRCTRLDTSVCVSIFRISHLNLLNTQVAVLPLIGYCGTLLNPNFLLNSVYFI